jgi:hypothetical protein
METSNTKFHQNLFSRFGAETAGRWEGRQAGRQAGRNSTLCINLCTSSEECVITNTTLNTLLVEIRKVFSSQQGLSGKAVHLIVEGCQHLKKLSLDDVTLIFDDDIVHVIKKLGGQLTTLILDGEDLTDVAFSYLNNCAR